MKKRKRHSDATKKKMSMASCKQPRIDLTGWKIGKLTVVWPSGYALVGVEPRAFWLCFCDCGNFKVFEGKELRRKGARSLKSCGCRRRNIETSLKNLYAQYRHKAKERGYEWALSLDQFRFLVTSKCYYTGREPQQLFTPKGKDPSPSILWNGIDRVDNAKGYTVENCVPAWGVVNKMKLTLTKDEFLAICREVSNQHKGE
jgi:hypothetical protein